MRRLIQLPYSQRRQIKIPTQIKAWTTMKENLGKNMPKYKPYMIPGLPNRALLNMTLR